MGFIELCDRAGRKMKVVGQEEIPDTGFSMFPYRGKPIAASPRLGIPLHGWNRKRTKRATFDSRMGGGLPMRSMAIPGEYR